MIIFQFLHTVLPSSYTLIERRRCLLITFGVKKVLGLFALLISHKTTADWVSWLFVCLFVWLFVCLFVCFLDWWVQWSRSKWEEGPSYRRTERYSCGSRGRNCARRGSGFAAHNQSSWWDQNWRWRHKNRSGLGAKSTSHALSDHC